MCRARPQACIKDGADLLNWYMHSAISVDFSTLLTEICSDARGGGDLNNLPSFNDTISSGLGFPRLAGPSATEDNWKVGVLQPDEAGCE